MTDTDRTTLGAEDRIDPPEPGISLSIRFPLVLEPTYRQPGGMVIMAWAADTGEALFCRRITAEDLDDGDPTAFIAQPLPRMVPKLFVAAYDGDDGRLVQSSTIKPPDTETKNTPGSTGKLFPLSIVLGDAAADPDKPCSLCDEDVPDGADFDRSNVHRECLLANVIGPLGHHLDHGFWCENMADPHCGRGVRQANLDLMALVDEHGLEAIVTGDFRKTVESDLPDER